MNEDIFIQIPSYRDKELQATLYDLIHQAAFPERLRIVVAWQYGPDEVLDSSFAQKHRIDIIPIPANQSLGCNWARRMMQENWNGEKYTLLLDSHHRFIPGWDQLTIGMYKRLQQAGISKPILSGYLPSYDPQNDPAGRGVVPLRICFSGRERGLLFRLGSRQVVSAGLLQTPFPAKFISLHFLFTEGEFNREIMFDPSIYFFADEVAISLRAYTSGYNMYHPHIIPGWHLYNRSGTRIPHWKDHPDSAKQIEKSYLQLEKLYSGKLTGEFAPGFKKSITEYENYIGRKLVSRPVSHTIPDGFFA